jgi:hypothetical protein
MKRISMTLTVAFFLCICQVLMAEAVAKKYDVKSGIVTMDSVIKIGKMEIKTVTIVYFDDFGIKECKETYMDGKMNGTVFNDGKNKYSLDFSKKIAKKTEKANNDGTELRVDINWMASKKDLDSGKVKKGAPMTIAGKQCEIVETVASNGEITQYGGWKKVLVYMKTGSAAAPIIIKANKIEENATVPASKFMVPAGFTLQ